MGLYWGVGSIYVMMDYFNLPKWIRKYKVQLGTNEPVDRKRLITVRPCFYLRLASPTSCVLPRVAVRYPNKEKRNYHTCRFDLGFDQVMIHSKIDVSVYNEYKELLYHPSRA